VSDEFTVPLCAIHHTEATGNEGHWWQKHKIDPLPIASNCGGEAMELRLPITRPMRATLRKILKRGLGATIA